MEMAREWFIVSTHSKFEDSVQARPCAIAPRAYGLAEIRSARS